MNIKSSNLAPHWNYYLALEQDMERISRFIEFDSAHLNVYSIEFTRIFLSACSEIDVLLKEMGVLKLGKWKGKTIHDYRLMVQENFKELINERIYIHRFGFEYVPWESWNDNTNPLWWRSYNNVKHHRNDFYSEANLENTLNALGALLVITVYYYQLIFQERNRIAANKIILDINITTQRLNPKSRFFFLKNEYYHYPVYFY